MKGTYRGFEITVNRERAMGGWENVYYTIVRLSDGWYLEDSFTEDTSPLRELYGYFKARVDDYYAHPEEYDGR